MENESIKKIILNSVIAAFIGGLITIWFLPMIADKFFPEVWIILKCLYYCNFQPMEAPLECDCSL